MTIFEAISEIDEVKHNTYDTGEKIKWLSAVDGMVKRLIVDTHEGAREEAAAFSGYTKDTPPETVLLIPEPFDRAYLHWMEAQIDYHNAEFGRYNNAIELFNTEWKAYESFYHRTHMPKGAKGGFR